MASQQHALITGANKGIGLEIARQLGALHLTVWLGCRDNARGEQAAAGLREAGIDARAVQLDVTDDASIRAAVATIGAVTDRLDVLVNNAGVSLGGFPPVSEESIDTIRATFEVNTFGPVRVTQAFLPMLRQAGAARIVMMSSELGSIASALDMSSLIWPVGVAGYSASKSALNIFTAKFAKELAGTGIKVNAADPGYTATDLNGHSGPRSVQQAAGIAVALATLSAVGPTGGFP